LTILDLPFAMAGVMSTVLWIGVLGR